MADLMPLSAQDLCVHRWREVPCIDLADPVRPMPPAWRCGRCDLSYGDGSRRIESHTLPAIGHASTAGADGKKGGEPQ